MNMWQVSRCSLRLAGRKRAISGWTAGCCSIRRSTTIGYGTAYRIGPWARRPGPKRQERWSRPRTKGTIMADMHGEPTMEEILASIRRIIAAIQRHGRAVLQPERIDVARLIAREIALGRIVQPKIGRQSCRERVE